MTVVFYITNHGFGHASRNVPIIEWLISYKSCTVHIKSDQVRCDFLKRNLEKYESKIIYHADCKENGLILQDGKMIPDIEKMQATIEEDFLHWDDYIEREKLFLSTVCPNVVVSDVICWAIKAAHDIGIPSLLIGNFTWSQMYKSFYDEHIWKVYYDYYQLANQAVWYDIHSAELDNYCGGAKTVSLVSRKADETVVRKIREQYNRPIVFVSNGASADFRTEIDVEKLPYDFIITRGIQLKGDNVHELPLDMINTPDYIGAADYVIAKGGWSTVAEVLLQRKPCALILRGNNSEDNNTKQILESRGHCIAIQAEELENIEDIIERIKMLQPASYDLYHDDTDRICQIIIDLSDNSEVGT